MSNIKGWRTIAFNVISILVTLSAVGLQYVGELGLTPQQIATASIVMALINQVGNTYLRIVTTTPVGVR